MYRISVDRRGAVHTNSIVPSNPVRQVNCHAKDVLESLVQYLFGCPHRKTTFPLTCEDTSDGGAARRRATYVSCLECGAELAYDWEQMRVGPPRRGSHFRQTRWSEWRFERDEIG